MSRAPRSIYVRRREERAVLEQLEKVRGDGVSRALLLYGPGGVGKTMLVQQLAAGAVETRPEVAWPAPVDVDDSRHWLLYSLETTIADALDPEREYFGPFFDYLVRLTRHDDEQVDYETVLTQLGRIDRAFIECYTAYTRDGARTVVVTFDTVEAVRSTYLLLTLTQWMKRLPSTLFVLAGRPLTRRESRDPLEQELTDPHRPLEHSRVDLAGFDEAEAALFLTHSELDGALTDAERAQLIRLTEGQPLWLALAVEYLQTNDLPPEMSASAAGTGRSAELFRRRLITLYRSSRFWSEAIKRLAVVRQGVSRAVWQRLMADRSLPPDAATWDDAWALLLRRPWIRPRSNGRYVTLHDALAEELAQRLLPLHDQDESWMRDLWRRSRRIYAELVVVETDRLSAERRRLATLLDPGHAGPGHAVPGITGEIAALNVRKSDVDQLRTAHLHYSILDDVESGTALFLAFYDEASDSRDPLFMELICREIERFVSAGGTSRPLEDVIGGALGRIRRWLLHDAPERHVQIITRVARFLIGNEQPRLALALLSDVPRGVVLPAELRYRLANDRGNACMRIPERIDEALDQFDAALACAQEFPEPDSAVVTAQAQKELGFYYRNLGRWNQADRAYETARDVLSAVSGPGSSRAVREEMASIQTNWAYLKALRGGHREARNLVDAAISVRRRLGDRHGEGQSLSVSGEVHRYEGRFLRAWRDYTQAETVFHELRTWPWLGLLYQEMAVCLHQAQGEGVRLLDTDQHAAARDLALRSLEICRESAVRAYPSALNRAGRIFAEDDPELGIRTLGEAIDEARRIGDGWFLSANLMEYTELNYRVWAGEKNRRDCRVAIDDRADEVARAIATYEFPDLIARWELLQGHLIVQDFHDDGRTDDLDRALRHYAAGFRGLADSRIGSHGSAGIAREFVVFRRLFEGLPVATQREWYENLRDDWSDVASQRSTSLLARLEELY